VQDDIKPYALLIMSEDNLWEDIVYYGIQQPLISMGLLCERIQISLSDENENENLQRQLKRIQNAKVVVFDASQIIMSPMLSLYLGYAWGVDVPTLEFDEKHYIRYKKIGELQDRLGQ
jgi:hypothetical protein